MTEQEASELLKKYKDGLCTPEELAFMDSWYKDLENTLPDLPYTDSLAAARHVWQTAIDKSTPQRRSRTLYWPVAAAIVAAIATSVFYFNYRKPAIPQVPVDLYSYNKAHDIGAGTNKAILTLANGQKVILDSARLGEVALQGGVSISQNKAGQLVYKVSPSLPSASLPEGEKNGIAFNTITTPNGGTYEVFLPEGSHVYLNAASSLKFPTAFIGAERKVILSGEAYFEVTKNQNQPFIVSSSNQNVKVLGTHFNVTSYAGDAVKTTLAEGKVELSSPAFSKKSILKPGEQATASKAGFDIIKVNAEDVSAWKDGVFVFRATPLPAVLKQLSRWYDVEVADDLQIPNINFDGEISRDQPLSELLFVIQETSHVKLKIEGRRIVRQL